MKTVKEISDITGISVRALHYYDEIGLLKPTVKNKAGYRFYNDEALETLQQILFFREFDIPLKEIKTVINDPALGKRDILLMQRKMLVRKKERTERLIASIDDILKGENKMDFEVFNQSEIEAICQSTITHMPDFLRESIIKEWGGLDQWKKHYIERASKEDMQKGYQKWVEWFGDKEKALDAMLNPPSPEAVRECQKKSDLIHKKLASQKDLPTDSAPVEKTITEYARLMKQLYQIKNEAGIMHAIASDYKTDRTAQNTDQKYGKGTASFIAEAIENYYRTKN